VVGASVLATGPAFLHEAALAKVGRTGATAGIIADTTAELVLPETPPLFGQFLLYLLLHILLRRIFRYNPFADEDIVFGGGGNITAKTVIIQDISG
jgi:hypothetical protein